VVQRLKKSRLISLEGVQVNRPQALEGSIPEVAAHHWFVMTALRPFTVDSLEFTLMDYTGR
jgi:hypothetical protein